MIAKAKSIKAFLHPISASSKSKQKRGRKGVEAAPCEGDDSENIIKGREGGVMEL